MARPRRRSWISSLRPEQAAGSSRTSALKVSPAFLPPATDAPLYTAVGGEENEGFHLQNRLIGERWGRLRESDIPCPGENHFTVLDQLCNPESGLFKSVLEMTGL